MVGAFTNRWWRWLAPVAIAVVAAALRLHGLDAGLPAINDPDELMFQMGALKMVRSGTLNPGWFGHPALTTMYALAITDILVFVVGYAFGWFADVKEFASAIYADPTWLMLPSRLVMILFSLGTVWLAGRFATRQWSFPAGLAAAAILAVSPVFVEWSQVIRSDIVACFFMLLAILAAQRISEGFSRADLIRAALWTACAVASKWPFAMTATAIAGAIVFDARQRGDGLVAVAVRLAAYAAMSFGFLVLIAPYLLLDFSTVVRNVTSEAQVSHLGATGGSLLWNARWYVMGPLWHGLGVLGSGLVLIGLARLARSRQAVALLTPPLIAFSLLVLSQNLVWERWALPLLVLLALPAGEAAAWLAASLRRAIAPIAANALTASLVTLILLPLTWANFVQSRERDNDTRQIASVWAIDHIPPGSKVLIESFAFDLRPQPWTFYFPLGDLGCVDAKAWLNRKVGYAKIEAGRGNRAIVDYGTITRTRENTCRPDFAILTNYDRYLAERGNYPAEVATYEKLIARGRVVATIMPVSGESAGPIVRIVEFGNAGKPTDGSLERNKVSEPQGSGFWRPDRN